MTSDADQNDAVERKTKPEEYRRILDQQLAEQKQRKQEELQRQKLLEADDFEMTSNLNTGINYISSFFHAEIIRLSLQIFPVIALIRSPIRSTFHSISIATDQEPLSKICTGSSALSTVDGNKRQPAALERFD